MPLPHILIYYVNEKNKNRLDFVAASALRQHIFVLNAPHILLYSVYDCSDKSDCAFVVHEREMIVRFKKRKNIYSEHTTFWKKFNPNSRDFDELFDKW